jgi:hypothetical protein
VEDAPQKMMRNGETALSARSSIHAKRVIAHHPPGIEWVIFENDGLMLIRAILAFRKPYNGSTFLPTRKDRPLSQRRKSPNILLKALSAFRLSRNRASLSKNSVWEVWPQTISATRSNF